MYLEIPNHLLPAASELLDSLPLKGSQSRARTRALALVTTALETLGAGEVELLNTYGVKNADGELVREGDTFELKPETASEYQAERARLLSEVSIIDEATYAGHEALLLETLEGIDLELKGALATAYDQLLTSLEQNAARNAGDRGE